MLVLAAAVVASNMTMQITATVEAVTSEIAPAIGATSYTLGREQLDAVSQGAAAPFSQVLLRSPGVVQDSYGEDHIRGEHGNIQYRINGVLLPESLNGFAPDVDTHFIDHIKVTTGSLPAEFGFRTSGIIDITTKTGSNLSGGEANLYAGSFQTLASSLQYGRNWGSLDYAFSTSYKHTALGIENPVGTYVPLHDLSDQGRAFGYLSWQIDPGRRLSLLLSGSQSFYQIPDVPGLHPGYLIDATEGTPPPSAQVNDRQGEQNAYAVLAYQQSGAQTSFQLALFSRYGHIGFTPDRLGDLEFDGVAAAVDEAFLSNGLQLDVSRHIGDDHTVRFGALESFEIATRETTSALFEADSAGQQTTTTPFEILDSSRLLGLLSGIYLQDEWHPLESHDRLTVNGGLRYDRVDTFFRADQLSPRLNLVWKIDDDTTAHAGYARYFTPPTLQYLSPGSLGKYAGTTAAPGTFQDDAPYVERAHYFDLGITRRLLDNWNGSLDAFYKNSTGLIDLGQFGTAVILAPFNYRVGQVGGGEAATSVHFEHISFFANFSLVYTQARDIDSAQFEFPPAELAYIQTHWIRLDHEGEYTSSGGATWNAGGTKLIVDALASSGLRYGFANEGKLPNYYPVNVAAEHAFAFAGGRLAVKARVDVTNLFDEIYPLRAGSGIGILAPQYGPRRGVFGTIGLLF